MKTDKINSNSKIKALLALAGIFSFAVFLTSIILHLKPSLMADSIIDFSTHHYFLMGFISLIVVLICYKSYETLSIKIEEEHQLRKKLGITRSKRVKQQIITVKNSLYQNAQKLVSKQVDKQVVGNLIFDTTDVLVSEEDKIQRYNNLTKAMMLGNAIKHKVKIYFRDKESNKHIETTVWQANQSHISLKGGLVLPVRSIYKVEI